MEDARRVVLYCRESRDENGENFERIETQRDILLDFCRRRQLNNIVGIILDDDKSGTDFSRFDSIVRAAQRREIDVLVFKDSSRLGRNLRESLNFIEQMQRLGVQVLFESEEYSEDFFPLLAWFHEQRAKEDSRKIRRVLRHKMETGQLLIRAPFGYRRENGLLVPDEDFAGIVLQVFRRFAAGEPCSDIARALTDQGIPTPSQVQLRPKACSAWNRQHIGRILQNPVYEGTMVYARRTNASFKDKHLIERPPEDWVVLEHHHAPIVPHELFEQVQRLRSRGSVPHRSRQGTVRPLSGLLRCGRCGSTMVLRTRKGRRAAYVCSRYHRQGPLAPAGESGCLSHRVLEEAVLRKVAARLRELLLENRELVCGELSRRSQGVRTASERLKEREGSINRILEQIYEDRLQGRISQELFEKKYGEYQRQLGQCREQLREQTEAPRPKNPGFQELLDQISAASLRAGWLRLAVCGGRVYLPGECTGQREPGLSQTQRETLARLGGVVLESPVLGMAPYPLAARWL